MDQRRKGRKGCKHLHHVVNVTPRPKGDDPTEARPEDEVEQQKYVIRDETGSRPAEKLCTGEERQGLRVWRCTDGHEISPEMKFWAVLLLLPYMLTIKFTISTQSSQLNIVTTTHSLSLSILPITYLC